MKKRIDVFFSYAWKNAKSKTSLTTNAYKAFKKIRDNVKKPFKVENININLRRLRASAGGFIFDNIYKMIREADILIFDVSSFNSNVYIELGIALSIQREINPDLKVFLIREKKKGQRRLPSNLDGFFYSEYEMNGSQVTFKDSNSLRQNIINHVRKKIQDYNLTQTIENINEITNMEE